MIDEKLKEFFNKFPHIKENKPLQNTMIFSPKFSIQN